VHRHWADGDDWFVVNRKQTAQEFAVHLRITGKVPELWRAETGRSEPAGYLPPVIAGETIVPLELAGEESVHLVFRKATTDVDGHILIDPDKRTVANLDGTWSVSFQPGRGAPATATLPALAPLNANAEFGISHFAGVATYRHDLVTPRGWTPGQPLWLNLGEVREMAEVSVNGTAVGTVWHPPYRVNVGAALHPGTNAIAVRVATLWVNRLIGDAVPGATKVAWTSLPTYRADAPLRPAGLIGPVTLEGTARQR
jgi:hypothetical protein